MPAAAAIPAAISGGSSLISGLLGSSAAKNAANAQVASQQQTIASNDAAKNQALATQQGVYTTDQSALAPFQQAGTASLSQLAAGTASGGVFNSTPTSDQVLAQDPGYAFRLKQGQDALTRAEAAGGSVGSGGALKAGVQYGQDFASNEYNNAYNRFMTTRQSNYNNLAGLANLGSTANAQLIGAGSTYGGQATSTDLTTANADANALTGIGNARAAGDIGSANAWGGALSGLAKAGTSMFDKNGKFIGSGGGQ